MIPKLFGIDFLDPHLGGSPKYIVPWSIGYVSNNPLIFQGLLQKEFEALRKKFNRRKRHLTDASTSGTETSDVKATKQDVIDYGFVEWLTPHQATRRTSTNLNIFDTRDDNGGMEVIRVSTTTTTK